MEILLKFSVVTWRENQSAAAFSASYAEILSAGEKVGAAAFAGVGVNTSGLMELRDIWEWGQKMTIFVLHYVWTKKEERIYIYPNI